MATLSEWLATLEETARRATPAGTSLLDMLSLAEARHEWREAFNPATCLRLVALVCAGLHLVEQVENGPREYIEEALAAWHRAAGVEDDHG